MQDWSSPIKSETISRIMAIAIVGRELGAHHNVCAAYRQKYTYVSAEDLRRTQYLIQTATRSRPVRLTSEPHTSMGLLLASGRSDIGRVNDILDVEEHCVA